MRRKAQAISLIGVAIMMMLGTGSVLGSIVVSDTLTESVRVNSGSIPVIAETKIRAEHYPDRMSDSLSYAYNTSTYELAQDGGGVEVWSESTTYFELENNLNEELMSNIQERNGVYGCEDPSISTTTLSTTTASITLDDNELRCEGENTVVSIPITDTVRVQHYNNPYISGGTPEQGEELDEGMLSSALDVNEKIESQVEHQKFEASRSSCEEDVDDYEEDLEEPALNSASSSADNHYTNSLLDLSDVEENMINSLSISVERESLTGTSSAEKKVEEDSDDCYQGCWPVDGQEECVDVYDDKIIAEAEYDPSSVTWDVNIEDSEEIITAQGLVNLILDYDYFQDL